MRLLAIILVAGLFQIGCGKKDSGGSVSAQSGISGEFAADFILQNGDVIIFTMKMNNGQADARSYLFPAGNMTTGHYIKSIGTYSLSGNLYTFNYSYETCNPEVTETATITKLDDVTYLFEFPEESVSVTGYKQDSVDAFLNDIGMELSIEDTGCSILPQ